MLSGATAWPFSRTARASGELLDLDQHGGLHLVGQDILGIGLDRLGEIGRGRRPIVSASACSRPRVRNTTALPGSVRTASSRSASRSWSAFPQRGPPHQGLGPERRVVVGQRDCLVEGFHGFLRIAAGQQVQLGDLELGLRLLWAELHGFFQIGQGLAAVGPPEAGLAVSRPLPPCSSPGWHGRALLAVRLPRCARAEAIKSLAKAVLPLSRPFFKAPSQSWITSARSSGDLGAEFLLGGLVEIGLTLVFRTGRNGKAQPPGQTKSASGPWRAAASNSRRVMQEYSITKGLLIIIIFHPSGGIESRIRASCGLQDWRRKVSPFAPRKHRCFRGAKGDYSAF